MYVNVSTVETYNHSAFIDWNRSLVGWWRFEENNGTQMNDSSTWGNNGSCSGSTCPSWTTGARGKALKFDGSNDYVKLGSLTITTATTVEAWIKTTTSAQRPVFSNRGDGLYFGVTGGHFFTYYNTATPASMSAGGIVNDDIWHYVVWVSDGTNSTMFIDGINVSTIAQSRSSSSSSTGYIGFDSPNSEYFPGTIDEVKVWNRALSAQEINASFRNHIHCYDNETEIYTKEGWKFFEDITFEDEIATLNATAKKVEYHNPEEIQNYQYKGEMYNITTNKGNLIVSPEHKIYAKVENDLRQPPETQTNSFEDILKAYAKVEENVPEPARGALGSKDLFIPQALIRNGLSRLGQGTANAKREDYLKVSFANDCRLAEANSHKDEAVSAAAKKMEAQNLYPNDLSLSTSCLVLNTSTTDCSSKCGSLDQMGVLLSAKDNARYSVSSLSGIRDLACSRNFSNLSFGIDSILVFSFPNNSSSSSDESPEIFSILDLCFSNSSNKYSGEYNLTKSEKIMPLVTPLPIRPQKKMVASITSSTYNSSGYIFLYLLCNDLFTSLPNLKASSSVILDLDTIFLNLSNASALFSSSSNSSLASSDQFTHGKLFNSALTSSDRVNVAVPIYSLPSFFNCSNFLSSSSLLSMPLFITSFQFTFGYSFLSLLSSLGADMVNVAILVPPVDSVYNMKSVDIYKASDSAARDGSGIEANKGKAAKKEAKLSTELAVQAAKK
ncbi:MAG: LamG-like jellyroll fold domain-containing protein, partial [Candidatus Woesearchaeota archaeon]